MSVKVIIVDNREKDERLLKLEKEMRIIHIKMVFIFFIFILLFCGLSYRIV